MKQRFGLSGYQLKMIAIVFMFLDHVYMHVTSPIGGHPEFVIFDVLSRFVSPLFLFLMVEGFFHTRSRKKYLTRLIMASIIMAIGNVITHLIMHTSINIYTILNPNIFLSLAGGFGIIWILNTIVENKNWWLIIPLIVVSMLTLFTEASFETVLLSYFMYAARKTDKKWISYIGLIFISLFSLQGILSLPSTSGSLWVNILGNTSVFVFTTIPFIYLYNGKKGGKGTKFEKNFFYGFYPIHIWVLYIIGQLLIH